MASRRKSPKSDKPPWAGKSGPGYEFDGDGDLRWFASVSFMVGREKLAKVGLKADSLPPPPKK